MENNILKKVDAIMLKHLEELDKCSVKDKNFKEIKEKAKAVTLVSDKIIQSQVAQLKFDVWNHSKNIAIAKAHNTAPQIAFEDMGIDND